MYYVFGLGNPGKKYDGTRHNVGRDFLERLVPSGSWDHNKHANAKVANWALGGTSVALVAPETYMNRSGETARFFKEKQGVPVGDMIVVYDDVALPLGEVKISVGRGDGGHNGLKSLIAAVGKDFIRVRVGVAGTSFWTGEQITTTGKDLSRHVLGKFSFLERKKLETAMQKAESTLQCIIEKGVESAMNECNKK